MATIKQEAVTPAKREVNLIPVFQGKRFKNFSGKKVITRVTAPGRLDEGKILYKFPLYLCIPTSDEQAKELYKLTISDLIILGVKNLATRLDDPAKKILFAKPGTEELFSANEVEENLDLIMSRLETAQTSVDSWRYSQARKSGGNKKLEGAKENVLSVFGRLGATAEDIAEIGSMEELVAFQTKLLAKAAKK